MSRLVCSFCLECQLLVLIHYVAEEIFSQWQNHSFLSNKYVSQSNFTSSRNELWKNVSLTRFQKPQLKSFSISFKFKIHPCLLLYLLFYLYLLLTFEQLFLYFTQLCGSLHCPNFGKFCDTAPLKLLIKSFSFQYKLEGGLYQRWLIIRYFRL